MGDVLVKQVVQLHELRVTVHKAYDGAFQHLLTASGGGVEAIARTYPFVVGCATSRFTTLSRRVRAAASVLEALRNSVAVSSIAARLEAITEAAQLIRKLQQKEQDRLQLVAASHLEQSRLWAMSK